MIIYLQHPTTHFLKKCPTGFSFTCLLFTWLVPLIRGDIKWFLLSLFLIFVTFGIFWLILPCIYNKIYIKELLEKGYRPHGSEAEKFVNHYNFIAK